MNEITVQLKDRLLKLLLDRYPRRLCHIDSDSICKELSISKGTLITMLEAFKTSGFLEELIARYAAIDILLDFNAVSEFIDNGGFQNEYATKHLYKQRLQLEVQKLKLEVEKLSGAFPEATGSFERLLTAAGNIASIAGLVIK
jgi:hypothetical protein